MHYLELTLPTIAENLALDEALLVEAEERGGPPALRLWEPESCAIVLGASCRFRDDVYAAACIADGITLARRSSGGGTVMLGPGVLCAAVVLPISSAPGLADVDVAQRYVLERMAAGLCTLGAPVEVLGLGDLVLGGRKFAGSAQRRLRKHLMVHISLLYDFPIERVGRYIALPARQPAYRAGRAHADFLTNLAWPRAQIAAALRLAWLAAEEQILPAPWSAELVRELATTRFANPEWTERL